jgi:hypothetical protein
MQPLVAEIHHCRCADLADGCDLRSQSLCDAAHDPQPMTLNLLHLLLHTFDADGLRRHAAVHQPLIQPHP